MFSSHQPVTQYLEKSPIPDFHWSVEVTGKRAHRFLVDFEKQAVLAAEVLEDGSFGDAKKRRDISHPRGMAALLGKRTHGCVSDPGSLTLRPRPRRHIAIAWRRDNTASNSTH